MSTTTIRLEDDLKSRVAAAAQRSGKSPHAFILDAIQQTVEQSEADDAFERLADERWARLLKSGKAVPFDVAKAYIEARAQGSSGVKPAARAIKPQA
jgi:predicted transcriptional regulator